MEACVVLVTVPDRECGRRLAEALVAERLAACVSQLPGLRSRYRWQGAIEDEPEELLLIKTRRSRFPDLARRVRELHPYQVPEILALPVLDGWQPYLEWLAAETRP